MLIRRTALIGLGLFVCCALASLATAASLTPADCVKCHVEAPAQIEANGAAHKSEIDCLACHAGHPPQVQDIIPACSDCHAGDAHYEVDGCLGCHNPHQPLMVNLEQEHKAVCLTCHEGPGVALQESPSQHATFACNFCHATEHGVIPECVECHSPHSETMTQQNCAACHEAHQPLELAYGPETGSDLCAACHDTAYDTLQKSQAKHSQIACVTCHVDQHKNIPQCNDCHGLPHAESIHARFPTCGECHSTAHDLNNWPNQK